MAVNGPMERKNWNHTPRKTKCACGTPTALGFSLLVSAVQIFVYNNSCTFVDHECHCRLRKIETKLQNVSWCVRIKSHFNHYMNYRIHQTWFRIRNTRGVQCVLCMSPMKSKKQMLLLSWVIVPANFLPTTQLTNHTTKQSGNLMSSFISFIDHLGITCTWILETLKSNVSILTNCILWWHTAKVPCLRFCWTREFHPTCTSPC